MPKRPDFELVSNPARGTSVKEQALHMMGKPGGIAKPLAGEFVKAVLAGLELKDSPLQTRIDTLKAVAAADKTDNQSIATEAGYALYNFAPNDPIAKAAVSRKLG